MKRQEALDLAKEHVPNILKWLSLSYNDKHRYCPLKLQCEICETIFTKKRFPINYRRCPCYIYRIRYLKRRIKQLAKEQGINLREEVKPS